MASFTDTTKSCDNSSELSVNLFELYFINEDKTRVVQVCQQCGGGDGWKQGDGGKFPVCVDGDDWQTIPVRDFTIDRLMSYYDVDIIVRVDRSNIITAAADSATSNNNNKQKTEFLVSVAKSRLVEADEVLWRQLQKLTQRNDFSDHIIETGEYHDRWPLHELVFTNRNNTIIMYYTGEVITNPVTSDSVNAA